jgi:hypothetical protein
MTSSIKGDAGATRADAIQRMQEGFDKRESEIERKHHEEVRDLREAHREDMQKLGESLEDQIGKERALNRERLSDQDLRHQKEIDEMRALFQRQRERDARSAAKQSAQQPQPQPSSQRAAAQAPAAAASPAQERPAEQAERDRG